LVEREIKSGLIFIDDLKGDKELIK
jgi:hypothetical protein